VPLSASQYNLKPACLIIEGALTKKLTSPTKRTRTSKKKEEDTYTHTPEAFHTHRTDASSIVKCNQRASQVAVLFFFFEFSLV
jgi:hypothetical protein